MIGAELFSGAGGMSVGATLAGVDVRVAVEIDSYAAATFAHNHTNCQVLQKDIREVKSIHITTKKEQKILFGGPPCQGFSTSNQRTRNRENLNNWLFQEFIRLTKNWRPDWVVLENVRGLKDTEKGEFLEIILKSFRKLGYTVEFKILNAANFGVPQNRFRLFVVGSIEGISYKFPESLNTTKITVKDAIGDLPKLINGNTYCTLPYLSEPHSMYAKNLRNGSLTVSNNLVTRNSTLVLERYKNITQGGNWKQIPGKLMGNYTNPNRCHTGIYKRLKDNEPSIVIGNYRKNMLIHPTQNRGLSVREAARLQSFPDWFRFIGSIGFQQQQVGNAVPPLLAKAVFEKIMSYNQ